MTDTSPLTQVKEGTLLWEPTEELISNANVTRFMTWLEGARGLRFDSYDELWSWSVADVRGFWAAVWEYMGIKAHSDYTTVLGDRSMPGAQWFPGATLNYTEHALARNNDHIAIVFESELRPLTAVTYADLHRQVASFAAGLRGLGVRKGDRVASYMPNVPETVVALLATASIGAIWSACSPEFGIRSVVERFRQIEPKVLIVADGYRFGDKDFSKIDDVAEIQSSLSSLKQTIVFPYLSADPNLGGLFDALLWDDMLVETDEITFESVPFDHPLWVLYTSGTTGLPKPIVHGHGGMLLEHFKTLTFHMDLSEEDRLFWFTTTGWIMWNFLVGGLLVGATIQLFDGDPTYPNLNRLWRFAHESDMTYFGTSAPYIQACMKAGVRPNQEFDLSGLRGLGSTGAPLSPEGFLWVYGNVNPDLLLGSFSGGTDVCTGFVGPSPLLPVRAGEIQCRCLGAKVEAFDAGGMSVIDQVGELVLTEPLPSMPLYLWGDDDGSRYRESYFEMFPGVWRHGDWIKITDQGSCVISGRSDSTLNRGGIRMGSSDFYRVVEEMDEVLDCLVVDTGTTNDSGRLLLFVVTQDGGGLDDDLQDSIKSKLRRELSPRHAPDEIHQIDEVPRTLNGKKLEIPVKRILVGASVDEVISRDAMANPNCLEVFIQMRENYRA